MGGRYGIQSSFTSSDFTEVSSSGLDVSKAAGYSGKGSIDAGSLTGEQKEAVKTFENARSDFQMYQVGGKPQGADDNAVLSWAQTVGENPLPLTYDITVLSSLLTSRYFPNDVYIDRKRENIENARYSYCMTLEMPYYELCTSQLETEDEILIHFSNKYNKQTCLGSVAGAKFYVPQLQATNHYILGTLMDYGINEKEDERAPIPIVTISNTSAIEGATEWLFFNMDNIGVLQPLCREGYSSISDFMCCDNSNLDNCLSTIPMCC